MKSKRMSILLQVELIEDIVLFVFCRERLNFIMRVLQPVLAVLLFPTPVMVGCSFIPTGSTQMTQTEW